MLGVSCLKLKATLKLKSRLVAQQLSFDKNDPFSFEKRVVRHNCHCYVFLNASDDIKSHLCWLVMLATSLNRSGISH